MRTKTYNDARCPVMAQEFSVDRFSTSEGDLEITFLGHGSLLFSFAGMHLYVDPFSQVADYSELPKADVVLITHEHRDHLDPEALTHVRTDRTDVVCTERCAAELGEGIVLRNGDSRRVRGLTIVAVPAYNVVHKRATGEPFHPRGHGNGYVIGFGSLRVYVAGDTENTPEAKSLRNVDVAFLPMNLPYTMTPEMVADVALAVKPRVLYPYHFGSTDLTRLSDLLKDHAEIEVRLRSMA